MPQQKPLGAERQSQHWHWMHCRGWVVRTVKTV